VIKKARKKNRTGVGTEGPEIVLPAFMPITDSVLSQSDDTLWRWLY